MLRTLLVLPCVAYFGWLAVMAMLHPGQLLRSVGIEVAGIDGMNEIRAVYGGFPLVMALGLLVSLIRSELLLAASLAVATAMLGMVAGRVISIAVDQSAGRLPVIFLVIEMAIAAALLAAARTGRAPG